MRKQLAIALVVALALSACAGDDGADGAMEPRAFDAGEVEGTEVTEAATFDEEAGTVDVDLEVTADRQVIRRARLQLHASETREAFDEIVTLVQSAGGFVADANVFPTTSEDAQPEVTMTLRVPAARLDQTLEAIKGSVDDVVSETQSAEDVTEEFVDLEARLTNLEALETELRALLEETRMRDNADADEIITVFNELSRVRGEIEQLQGRLNYLSDLTALATVEIGITQTPSAAPLVEEPWTPAETVRAAIGSLVSGLQSTADWLINLGLYVLPMLLIVVGPLALIGIYAYRRFYRKPDEPAPASP